VFKKTEIILSYNLEKHGYFNNAMEYLWIRYYDYLIDWETLINKESIAWFNGVEDFKEERN
jgi:hypothetical protein